MCCFFICFFVLFVCFAPFGVHFLCVVCVFIFFRYYLYEDLLHLVFRYSLRFFLLTFDGLKVGCWRTNHIQYVLERHDVALRYDLHRTVWRPYQRHREIFVRRGIGMLRLQLQSLVACRLVYGFE